MQQEPNQEHEQDPCKGAAPERPPHLRVACTVLKTRLSAWLAKGQPQRRLLSVLDGVLHGQQVHDPTDIFGAGGEG